MAKRKYSTEDVLHFLNSNLSDIEEFIDVDDEVEDKDWTPNAEHDEESSNSSNEEDKSIDQRIEEEEVGPTATQATKQRGRGKVKSKEKRKKTHTAAEFDESVDQTSTEEEGPTATQAKRTNKSARKKVTRKESRWRKAEFEPPDVQFDESADEAIEERSEFTPYMYFKQFVTDERLQLVADQTNLFSVQKQGKSVNTTVKEIEQVLGMYMFMGLVQMLNVRAYWEVDTKYPKVADVMSQDRFEKLLTLLHFQNNLERV